MDEAGNDGEYLSTTRRLFIVFLFILIWCSLCMSDLFVECGASSVWAIQLQCLKEK